MQLADGLFSATSAAPVIDRNTDETKDRDSNDKANTNLATDGKGVWS
jgi:hypothetical protein